MVSAKQKQAYYQAMLDKNSEYEGLFYVGVKTTGVFCRSTCPARKPKFENCEFYLTAKEALLASFRPCKRCQPLSYPNDIHPMIKKLIEAIEANPEKRWKTEDLHALGIDDSTARRQFKKRYGMTFLEYARSRRMGLAMKQLKGGSKVIDTQLSAGYESSSGFRDAFARIVGASPTKADKKRVFNIANINTLLGPMFAVADENSLYLLEFYDRKDLDKQVQVFSKEMNATIIPEENKILKSIQSELDSYFAGKLKVFKTPLKMIGTPFQQKVWKQLTDIPYGTTRSYLDMAESIKHPKAFRAVGTANGKNRMAIIIPCHRVINAGGSLGGYAGGLSRKEWLLEHEKKTGK